MSGRDVQTKPAPRDGVLPDDFYSTTNLHTQVRMGGQWTEVSRIEMDVVILVDWFAKTAACVPMNDVRAGDPVVVGHEGIRVHPLERGREREIFSFMGSEVSSERPKRLMISRIAQEMRSIRERGGKILFVAGPAIVHSGAA